VAEAAKEETPMKLQETVISSESLYKGKIINLRRDVVRLENGGEALREVIEHPGGVGILPLDEDGMVYMVRQYRHGARGVELEIPAGKLNYGEDALECGKRELLEEIEGVVSFHDFRMVSGPSHTNIIFDIVLSHNCTLKEAAITEKVQNFVRTIDENYFVVITFDRVFSKMTD